MRWLALWLACAVPVCGQGILENDYALIFDADKESIIAEGNSERLDLPGGVVVLRQKTSDGMDYTAMDLSEGGAVGCMLGILMDFNRVATLCNGAMSSEQIAHLNAGLDRVSLFVAQNRVPQVSVGSVRSAIAAYARSGNDICERAEDADFKDFYSAVLTPRLDDALDEMLATPRLPVINPCL